MIHIFEKDKEYYLFNSDKYFICKLTNDLGRELKELNKENLHDIVDPLFSNIDSVQEKESGKVSKCKRLVLIINQNCNLNCSYCYAQGGTYGETKCFNMDKKTCQEAVIKFLDIFPEGIQNIMFFGGEPLLRIDFIDEMCTWIKKYTEKKGVEVDNLSVITNGTLIDDHAIDIFNKHNISLSISLDGNKSINDKNRYFRDKEDSVFDIVKNNIEYLNKKRNFQLDVEMTISNENILQFDKYNRSFLKDIDTIHSLNIDNIHCVPVMCNIESDESIYKGTDDELIYSYFDSLTEYSINSLKGDRPLPVLKLNDMLNKLVKRVRNQNYCMAGIADFSVNVHGDIYPCFALNNIPKMSMGNISDIVEGEFEKKQEYYRNLKYDNNSQCKQCWAKGVCSNCIANAYLVNGELNSTLDCICDMQKIVLERLIVKLDEYRASQQTN